MTTELRLGAVYPERVLNFPLCSATFLRRIAGRIAKIDLADIYCWEAKEEDGDEEGDDNRRRREEIFEMHGSEVVLVERFRRVLMSGWT